jgi:hypothetical protein
LTEIKNPSVIEFEDVSDEQLNQMIDGTHRPRSTKASWSTARS